MLCEKCGGGNVYVKDNVFVPPENTNYRKNRTLDNADRLCEAIDGVIVRAGSEEV